MSQIMGAMIATWCVYGMYKTEFDAIHAALAAGGAAGQAQIFSPSGVSVGLHAEDRKCLLTSIPVVARWNVSGRA